MRTSVERRIALLIAAIIAVLILCIHKRQPARTMKSHIVQINQIQLFGDITTLLERKHGVKEASPRQVNAIIRAATGIVEAFGNEDVIAAPGAGIHAWLKSDDRGLSSIYLASMLFPDSVPESDRRLFHPSDADDFGRCHRMLVVTGASERVRDLKPLCPKWAKLIENWDKLTTLYLKELEEGKPQKFQTLLNELLNDKPAK